MKVYKSISPKKKEKSTHAIREKNNWKLVW